MKTMSDEHSRREFLRSVVRMVFFGFGALGILFFFQRKQIAPSGQSCLKQGICRSCDVYHTCKLPAALSRRKALAADKD